MKNTESMPVLFVGHGSPMNAIEDNRFSKTWRLLGKTLPRPEAILCISAHWETRGTLVTAMEKPLTIHDFAGFPRQLFEVEYPAAGSLWLADETINLVINTQVKPDQAWGLDHGCWSVLRQMYPDADIPVIQLSLDFDKPAAWHYALGKELVSLRSQGVLILGSGNMVHNLGQIVFNGGGVNDFNRPFGLDWALEAREIFKKLISENRHRELADYMSLGKAIRLAVPTPEHYLPLLYALAQKQDKETVLFFNDQPVGGSLTMTSLIIDTAANNRRYKTQLMPKMN